MGQRCALGAAHWELVELLGNQLLKALVVGLWVTGGMFPKGTVGPGLLFFPPSIPGPEVTAFALSRTPAGLCCLAIGPKPQSPHWP